MVELLVPDINKAELIAGHIMVGTLKQRPRYLKIGLKEAKTVSTDSPIGSVNSFLFALSPILLQ